MPKLRVLILEAEHEVAKAAILKRRLAEADERVRRAWLAVHERMEEEGFEPGDDVKVGGTRYGYQIDWYAQVQNEYEFTTWAEEHGQQYLLKPRPSKTLLNQLAQASEEDGTPMPPGIGKWPKRWVSNRAAGSKK